MSLFVPYCPRGLEPMEMLRDRQMEAFHGLVEALKRDGIGKAETITAINHVIDPNHPSIDVGIPRLLGEGKIIADLDPCKEALSSDFYDAWDSDFDAVLKNENPHITELERTCLIIWKDLEENLEMAANHSVPESHWALRRWSSNFLLHLGALLNGHSAWKDELDTFTKLLSQVAKPVEKRSPAEIAAINNLDKQLNDLLNSSTTNQGSSAVQLSDAVTLEGEWVHYHLKPTTASSKASGSVSLTIEFSGKSGKERAVFKAPMYLWLTRLVKGKLDPRCFPQELLVGVRDARIRAAAKGQYAFENKDIELVVKTENEKFRLERIEGLVVVKHE